MPLQTWKDWPAFHFISDHAQFLPKAFDDANFNFYSKTLRDVPSQRDRWKRGVDLRQRRARRGRRPDLRRSAITRPKATARWAS